MGLFGLFDSNSTSNASDNRSDSSGAASTNQRGTNDTSARDSALAIGTNGRFVGSGSIEVQGSGKVLTPGSFDLSALRLGNGSALTINQSDPAVIQAALTQIGDLAQGTSASLSQYLDKVNASQAAASTAAQASTDKVLTQLEKFSEAKATNTQSLFTNPLVYVVLGVLGAIVAVVYFWRKGK